MMSKSPLISICIPTYNRKAQLEECLQSFIRELKKVKNSDQVEIIISDNDSQDDTKNLITTYTSKIRNLHYYKNKKNLGMVINLWKVGTYARGQYIWFFSDDDIAAPGSLLAIMDIIKKKKPQVILGNIKQFRGNTKHIDIPNTLGITTDYEFKRKAELFDFLKSKIFYAESLVHYIKLHIFYPIDWYTTYYSSMIIKASLFRENIYIAQKETSDKHMFFPHSALLYYVANDYHIYISSQFFALYRLDNISWNISNQLKFSEHWNEVLNNHYQKIMNIHQKDISLQFRMMIMLRRLIREVRIVITKLRQIVKD